MAHKEVPKLTRYIIITVIVAVIAFLVWYFSSIVIYILVSAVIAIVGKPLVTALTRLNMGGRHLSRWIASLITLILIWGIVIASLMIFVPIIIGELGELSKLDMSEMERSIEKPIEDIQRFIERVFLVSEEKFSLKDLIIQETLKLLNIDTINQASFSIVSTIGGIGVAIFSITFISFFFLKEENLFFSMVTALFPKRYELHITRALNSVNVLLMRYFTGIFAESLIITLLCSGSLMLFGMSVGRAFFIGITLGILNVIPYIGPLIALGIGIVVGLLSPIDGVSTQGMLLIITGCMVGSNAVDNAVLQPLIYSKSAKAHPLEIFLVLLIAGNVAGVLGMLLAVPAFTVIRVFAKEFFNNFRIVQKLTENI